MKWILPLDSRRTLLLPSFYQGCQFGHFLAKFGLFGQSWTPVGQKNLCFTGQQIFGQFWPIQPIVYIFSNFEIIFVVNIRNYIIYSIFLKEIMYFMTKPLVLRSFAMKCSCFYFPNLGSKNSKTIKLNCKKSQKVATI